MRCSFPGSGRPSPCHEVTKTQEHVNQFAKEGLRTLVLGERELTAAEYEKWDAHPAGGPPDLRWGTLCAQCVRGAMPVQQNHRTFQWWSSSSNDAILASFRYF